MRIFLVHCHSMLTLGDVPYALETYNILKYLLKRLYYYTNVAINVKGCLKTSYQQPF